MEIITESNGCVRIIAGAGKVLVSKADDSEEPYTFPEAYLGKGDSVDNYIETTIKIKTDEESIEFRLVDTEQPA